MPSTKLLALTAGVGLLVAPAAIGVPAFAATASAHGRSARFTTFTEHSTFDEPASASAPCAQPSPTCVVHVTGPTHWHGGISGDSTYDLYAYVDPADPTDLSFSGPNAFRVSTYVRGCGRGSFVAYNDHGHEHLARPDVATQSFSGENDWTIVPGSGTGQLSALLAPHGSRVIGVDGSDAMLAAARARMPDVPNVDLRVGDLEALPIDAATLDLGILSLVLHYVAEPPRALAEAFRVLAPGGRLVILDMQPHAREEYRQQMGHIWQGFDEAQMRDWLSNAGFSAIRVHALPVDETSRGPALFVASGTKI